MLNKKKNNKGFTLIELLVVIAIIGVLAVVAVPALFNNINKAKVADLKSDYNAYKSATLAYYTDNNIYPTQTKDDKGVITDDTNGVSGEELKTVLGSYMDNVPVKSPFDTDYTIKVEKDNLVLTTTYPKAATDKKLMDSIEKDTNKLITVEPGGVITMTLISPSMNTNSASK